MEKNAAECNNSMRLERRTDTINQAKYDESEKKDEDFIL